MPNKSYRKGYRLEKRVQKHLESNGWIIIRSAKSRFPDLVAIKHGKVMFVESKYNKYLSKDEKEKASRLIEHAPLYVYWNNNRKLDWYQYNESKKNRTNS